MSLGTITRSRPSTRMAPALPAAGGVCSLLKVSVCSTHLLCQLALLPLVPECVCVCVCVCVCGVYVCVCAVCVCVLCVLCWDALIVGRRGHAD